MLEGIDRSVLRLAHWGSGSLPAEESPITRKIATHLPNRQSLPACVNHSRQEGFFCLGQAEIGKMDKPAGRLPLNL